MQLDKDGNYNLHIKINPVKHPKVVEALEHLEKSCIDKSKFTRKSVVDAVKVLKGGK